MFDINKMLEFQDKNLIRKNINNLSNYKLIIDYIEVDSYNFYIALWLDGSITVKNNILNIDSRLCNKKLTGIGSRNYKDKINKSIDIFRENNKNIIQNIK